MRINIIILSLVLLAMPVFAQQTEFEIMTWQNNTEVNRNVLCSSIGGITCDNSHSCYITAYYPNWTLLISDKEMSFKSDGYYNYSFGNLTTTGDYYAAATCTDGNDYGTSDASFRVVQKILYKGGGLNMYEIAIIFGLVGGALVMGLIGMLSKSLWMRPLLLFSALGLLIVSGNAMMQIAIIEVQSGLLATIEGAYSLFIYITITVLALFIVNILWDLFDALGYSPQWAKNWNARRKKQELEE